jgi:hypothetical protein
MPDAPKSRGLATGHRRERVRDSGNRPAVPRRGHWRALGRQRAARARAAGPYRAASNLAKTCRTGAPARRPSRLPRPAAPSSARIDSQVSSRKTSALDVRSFLLSCVCAFFLKRRPIRSSVFHKAPIEILLQQPAAQLLQRRVLETLQPRPKLGFPTRQDRLPLPTASLGRALPRQPKMSRHLRHI